METCGLTFTLRNGSRQNLEDHPKVVLTGALFHACPGDLDALAMQLPSSACMLHSMNGRDLLHSVTSPKLIEADQSSAIQLF